MTAKCKISYNKRGVEGGGTQILSAPLQGEKSVTGPRDEVPSRGVVVRGHANAWFYTLSDLGVGKLLVPQLRKLYHCRHQLI